MLPGRLRDRVELDATPYLRPLFAVLDEAHRYAVVVVDRERGRLFEFHLGVLEARKRVDGRALRKPNFARGDKEHGVRNKAEELAKRHYREAAQALEGIRRGERHRPRRGRRPRGHRPGVPGPAPPRACGRRSSAPSPSTPPR